MPVSFADLQRAGHRAEGQTIAGLVRVQPGLDHQIAEVLLWQKPRECLEALATAGRSIPQLLALSESAFDL